MPLQRRLLLGLFLFFSLALRAETLLSGAVERREALARLGVLGSVLMIGAHPDDENTPTLAYFARGRLMRTAYLSLTRGEGGQNLIGSEQGAQLGIIRTQELLAARQIDGAEQFFTRAIDFGFSKTADETLSKWGREEVLGDIVWVIRKFRPDLVILCFSGTARDGHGHHQSAGILGREAFAAAADPKRFPEQLSRGAAVWQAKRLVWNAYGGVSNPDYQLDTGQWNAVIGYSYGELAGLSRSMHRSQGMGGPPRRGAMQSPFAHLAGDRGPDLLSGVDTSWARVSGGAAIGGILESALAKLDDAHPERSIPALLEARARIAKLEDPWARLKLKELDEAVALCAGLWLDASAERWDAVAGSKVGIRASALLRAPAEVRLEGIRLQGLGAPGAAEESKALPLGRIETREFAWSVPADAGVSQPYWLRETASGALYAVQDPALIGLAETPPVLTANFRLSVSGSSIEVERPVIHRFVDRSRGEIVRPLEIVPPVALRWAEPVVLFPDASTKTVHIVLTANASADGELRLEAPKGWVIEPAKREFSVPEAGRQVTLAFQVKPPAAGGKVPLHAIAKAGGVEVTTGMEVITYPHFPSQTVFPHAEAEAVRADVKVLARRIGYVMGAGDEIPAALEQLGCKVEMLGPDDLAQADLSIFEAIVTGVRAYNTRPDLRASHHRLLDYVDQGGTLLVQYVLNDRGTSSDQIARIGPYPIQVGRERVAVEEAPITFTNPASPLLQKPNRITAADFEGWVQERGLYFASKWDPKYQTLLVSNDPGEQPLPGGTLYARYGKGAYVFTAYSWFRQLPAGVPGAFRVFANLLSAGKVLP